MEDDAAFVICDALPTPSHPPVPSTNVPCCCKVQDRFVVKLGKLFCCFKVGQVNHGRRHVSDNLDGVVVENELVATGIGENTKIISSTTAKL
jgi:hypothetical protein